MILRYIAKLIRDGIQLDRRQLNWIGGRDMAVQLSYAMKKRYTVGNLFMHFGDIAGQSPTCPLGEPRSVIS